MSAESSEYTFAQLSVRHVADALEDGLAVCCEGRVILANTRLREWLGREDLEGLPIAEVFDPEHPPGCGRAVRISLSRGSSERRVEVRGHSLGEAEVFTVRDVTHVQSLEEELLRIGRELNDRRGELEHARERARHESKDREDLLTLVAHELRTPATVIGGYVRLLLAERVGPLEAEQRRFLEETLSSSQRLNAFIGNLLETSRWASGDAPIEARETPLSPTLEGIAASLQPLLAGRGLAIDVVVDPGGSLARFDAVRIEQVMINLLTNAIRHAPAESTIVVAAAPVQQKGAAFVEVSVTDEGCGVAADDRERVFLPYVRAGEKRRGGGLGLGLSIARRIVEAHGGAIWVEPGAAGGSRFAFTLPAAAAAVGGDA